MMLTIHMAEKTSTQNLRCGDSNGRTQTAYPLSNGSFLASQRNRPDCYRNYASMENAQE